MRTRQLSDMIADVRKVSDTMGATVAYPDADITELLNQGWTRIYGELTGNGENYYLKSPPTQFTSVAGQDTYYTTSASGVPAGTNLLPTDLYRIKGLDVQVQTNAWRTCARYQFEQRCDYPDTSLAWPIAALYDFQGSGAQASLRFMPIPPTGTVFRLWYYPAAVRLVSGSDTLDGGNGWEMYAIWWAARELATRDENYDLVGMLEPRMQAMFEAIRKEAASRNAGIAPKIRRSPRYKRVLLPGGWR